MTEEKKYGVVMNGIDMPPRSKPGPKVIWPWMTMEVGQCFDMPTGVKGRFTGPPPGVRKSGRKFSVRRLDANTIRVWRIE